VGLLVFQDDATWEARSESLHKLAERLSANPSLQLNPSEVDALSWGLTGAAPLFSPWEDRSIWWTMTRSAIQVKLPDPSSRPARLNTIREEIAAAATNLTTDESVATIRQVTELLLRGSGGTT
jgi:hypothetical protein